MLLLCCKEFKLWYYIETEARLPVQEEEKEKMIPFVILAMEDVDDRDFMTDVYLQYERLIWSEIRRKLKNHPEVEDVFQSVLTKLVANVKKLRSMDRNGRVNYIITVAQHCAIDELRRDSRAEDFCCE